MVKIGPSRMRPLMFWLTPITRSPAQKPAHKDLGRNDQSPVITPEATYVLFYAHNAFASPETCT
ncbi:Malolactic regulator [Lacticaseibacillus rhamnosus]|uniref:Malolactic regulator n=1 Tax=Lacticaseibacillus rhamnosus TaxID=47715 RepID=A0AAX0K5B7_LACRH|nr:Malolactic regulator [Lacticaseibacillus rhamnosus]